MDKSLLLFINYMFHDSPKRMTELMSRFDTLSSCVSAMPDYIYQTCMNPEMNRSQKTSPKSYEYFMSRLKAFDLDAFRLQLSALHIHVLTIADPEYPTSLKEISDAPPVLYYKGDLRCLSHDMVGVVGTRQMTEYGGRVTRHLSTELLPYFLIVSGLAAGVDTVAHQTAVDHSYPTVAVLGTGLDTIYPASNQKLSEKMIENGLLLSEYPPRSRGLAHRFPQRNRIVAGLSRGVLVTEAGEKSGALITARLAMEENRDVFVVPGSIFSDGSSGPHRLLRDGAILVTGIEDIISEYPHLLEKNDIADGTQLSILDHAPAEQQMTDEEKTIYDLLGQEAVVVDDVVSKSGLAVHQVLQSLTMFEVQDLVEQLPGKRFRRK